MEQISGYSVVIAKASVTQLTTKPFFGKAHVKVGQCYALWCYFFQVGGILAAKYSHRLDAFGPAFMGARGEPGAVEKYCSSYGAHLISQFPLDTMTFDDYVISKFVTGVNSTDDPATYLIQHGNDKIRPQDCVKLARDYSMDAAAVGAMHPEIIRDMFARTHTGVPNKQWQDARAAGLDIPERQDTMSYKETEEGEDQSFMEYCRTCCPTLYASLITPEVGRDIAWTDIIRQVFRVLEFDRAGTIIGPGNTVRAASPTSPYGYLLVESPILNQPTRLPIVHRDDFLLAASVYEEPPLLADTAKEELLVTYAPEHELPGGLAGISHALHYVITPRGTLDRYYVEDDMHMTNPAPEKLLGPFVWQGEIGVKINHHPNL